VNNEHTRIYPSLGPFRGGNSPTSSRLILIKTGVTRVEQSARMVRVLKGVSISCLLLDG
jgi:hypothetical protein